MAIQSVNRLYTERGGTHSIDNIFTFFETWEVLTDSVDDDESTAGKASGLDRKSVV